MVGNPVPSTIRSLNMVEAGGLSTKEFTNHARAVAELAGEPATVTADGPATLDEEAVAEPGLLEDPVKVSHPPYESF